MTPTTHPTGQPAPSADAPAPAGRPPLVRRIDRRLRRMGRGLLSRPIRSAADLEAECRRIRATVVSVDLFDTLVHRTTIAPEDVFRLQHRACRDLLPGLSGEDWLRHRKAAEAETAAAAAPGETSLEAVYRILGPRLGLSETTVSALRDAELDAEARVIRPYADLVEALARLRRDGVRIVVTTDTYLPVGFIAALLARLLPVEHDLLCSSETGLTKRSGRVFPALAARYPGAVIAHFGDNPHSDVVMAEGSGVRARLTVWEKQRRLQSGPTAYLRALGACGFPMPADGRTDAAPGPLDELAWTWAPVLADMLLSVRRYAREIGATDVWFLSRDCETMARVADRCDGLFEGLRCRYVVASRSACYPIIAAGEPELFRAWRGREPTDDDRRAGEAARRYYTGLVEPTTTHVLVVDIGWKGRLQALIARAVPETVRVSGYYFALEPKAVAESAASARSFVDWDLTVFNQAVVESLSGFVGPSCDRFDIVDGAVVPVFRPSDGDRSPDAYCAALERDMLRILGSLAAPPVDEPALAAFRRAVVRGVCLFPDRFVADAFAAWSIGTRLDGSDAMNLLGNPALSIVARALNRSGGDIPWPSGTAWTVSGWTPVVRALQRRVWARHAVDRLHAEMKRRRGAG